MNIGNVRKNRFILQPGEGIEATFANQEKAG